MPKFEIHSQVNRHTKQMEHSATVSSFDLVKVLEGYFRETLGLKFKYEELKEVTE
ncbi:MAG: hypothetical protein QF864_04515 [SAR202 cluster bacterium]|jgi:hypothetical protein|nr:hypothetical protein [SAR202 cluster bacterium]